MSQDEISKEEIADYMVAPPDVTLEEKQAKGMLVFCVDVSGSMASTVAVPELQSESFHFDCSFISFNPCEATFEKKKAHAKLKRAKTKIFLLQALGKLLAAAIATRRDRSTSPS